MDFSNFNVSTEDAPPDVYKPLPKGDYLCSVEGIEQRTSKAGNPYLNVKLRVVDGDSKGRVIFDFLMPSAEKNDKGEMSFGMKKFLAFAKSSGIQGTITGTHEQFNHKTVLAKVDVEEDDYNGGERNRVVWYKEIERNELGDPETTFSEDVPF